MNAMEDFAIRRLSDSYPGLRRGGLREYLRREFYIDADPLGFVPDAYRVYKEDGKYLCIELFEVEDTSKLSMVKLQNIARLWADTDAQEETTLTVFIADRYGKVTNVLDTDVFRGLWWERLAELAAEQRRLNPELPATPEPTR